MFKLRDYQVEAKDRLYERLGQGHRPIVCAPTGSGKTVIAADIAKDAIDRGEQVLFISFRREILHQTHEAFGFHCGERNVQLLMSGEPYYAYPPITVASADTLKARWHKSPVWQVPATTILVDEAHLSLSKKMLETVMPRYQDQTVIGFTATPARASGRGMGSFYTRIIQVRTVQQLIDENFLAPCEYWGGSHADLSQIRTSRGDYEQKDLSAAVNSAALIGDIVDNWLRIAPQRHTIVFATDIAHAVALTDRFKLAGINAECVHSKMDPELRTRATDAFKEKRFQVLVNVGIATYGYDVPSVNCVVLARPTKSIVFHLQTIGRGMRPKPDGDHCVVIDHADNVRRLGCAEDLIRWRLDDGREAATNVTKQQREQAAQYQTECGQCSYVFARSRTCPKCGWEKPARSRDVEVIEADLVQLRKAKSDELPAADRREWYARARGWCNDHGKKEGMAWYAYKEKFGRNPPNEWKHDRPLQADIKVNAYMQYKLIRAAKGKKRGLQSAV